MVIKRIHGFDIARALAVFGMVIVSFKTVVHASKNIDVWWLSIFNVLDGRASAVFVILAGVGITLLTNAARLSGDTERVCKERVLLLKRALFLFVVGLIYIVIWPADILHYYGVYIAAAAFLFTVSTKKLLLAATAIALTFLLLFFVLNYSTSWNWDSLAYKDFWSPTGFVRNLLFNGFHPVLPWLGFLVVGMAIGRLPWTTLEFAK